MSKESWFRAFERNLAENGALDERNPARAERLYQEAGERAFDEQVRRAPEEDE